MDCCYQWCQLSQFLLLFLLTWSFLFLLFYSIWYTTAFLIPFLSLLLWIYGMLWTYCMLFSVSLLLCWQYHFRLVSNCIVYLDIKLMSKVIMSYPITLVHSIGMLSSSPCEWSVTGYGLLSPACYASDSWILSTMLVLDYRWGAHYNVEMLKQQQTRQS